MEVIRRLANLLSQHFQLLCLFSCSLHCAARQTAFSFGCCITFSACSITVFLLKSDCFNCTFQYHEGLEILAPNIAPKPAYYLLVMVKQYWVGIVKSKQYVFRSILNSADLITVHPKVRVLFSQHSRLSRHTVVCRAAQENGARANGSEYINRNNKVAIFIDPSSFIRRTPNLLWKCPPITGGYIPKNEANRASRFRDTSEQSFSFVLRFFFLFAQTQKPLLLGNAYFNRAEIWHTCRATKSEYKYQIWGLQDKRKTLQL